MFRDRADAGEQLADALEDAGVTADVVVGVTRGGVPVARAVADRLGCPLGYVVVQKIGTPGREELALGAVASDGAVWLNDDLLADLGVEASVFTARREQAEAVAAEKADAYRGAGASPSLADKRVVVVDDGVATGATACAAVASVRAQGANEVIFAAPVGAESSVEQVGEAADEVVVVAAPKPFGAVGAFYDRFEQVGDEAVRAALAG
jgi:predicted phosphoribosyltransferase